LRDLEAVFKGSIRALAQAGVFGAQVTGMADGTDWETIDRYTGCGQVTCTVRIGGKQGRRHELEVTVYGWKVLLLIDAATKIPLAVKVGKIHEHEALWTRALVPQARLNLPARRGCTRSSLRKVFWMAPSCGGWRSAGSPLWCPPGTIWPWRRMPGPKPRPGKG
jgi:hypothetical protein